MPTPPSRARSGAAPPTRCEARRAIRDGPSPRAPRLRHAGQPCVLPGTARCRCGPPRRAAGRRGNGRGVLVPQGTGAGGSGSSPSRRDPPDARLLVVPPGPRTADRAGGGRDGEVGPWEVLRRLAGFLLRGRGLV